MDKTKIFEVAGKFASKGQLDKAAKEYQRVLDADPKDVRALQKLAEIHQKNGKFKEATDLMLRVAEGYTEQGFFLKAVAVYKQVLKSGQERIDVNLRLAQLYQQLGLVGDATQQFQLVANFHDKSGNVKESLNALRKMVDLDPDNVASRVKLGELYARERMNAEAVAELKRAAAYLKKNARLDDHLRVLERVGQLVPDDPAVAKELAHAFLARSDTKRALAKLQVCFRHNPKDVETLTLLAKAFSDLGQEAKTVSVYRELARVYQETNQPDLRRQTLERILQLTPGDPEATEGLAEFRSEPPAAQRPVTPPAPVPVAPAPAPAVIAVPPPPRPAPMPAPAPAPAPAAAPKPAPSLSGVSPALAKVLTETDVYLKYGLVQKAAEHIQKALAEDPASFPVNEKLLAILDKQGKAEDAVNLLARLVELARAKGDADRDSAYTQDLASRAPGHPLVAAAAAAADLGAVNEDLVIEADEVEARAAALATEAAGEVIEVEPTGPQAAPPRAATPAPAPSGPAPWDIEDSDEEVVVEAEPIEHEAAPRLDFGDEDSFNEALDHVTGPQPTPQADALITPADDFDGIALASAAGGDDAVVVVDDESPLAAPPPAAAELPDLPALPFGAEDDESTVVDERMSAHRAAQPAFEAPPAPAHAPFTTDGEDDASPFGVAGAPFEEEFAAAEAPPAEAPFERRASPFEASPPPARAAPPPAAIAPTPLPEPQGEDLFEAELAEVEFLLQQGLTEDARGAVEAVLAEAPHHPRALELLRQLSPAETSLPPAAAAPVPAAPPADAHTQEIAEELADELSSLDDAFSAIQKPAAPVEESAPPDGQYSVEDVLSEFKKKLATTVSSEDSQTHYDLGIAFKEMGLVDEAIHEFEVALNGSGRKRVIDCLNMLGICHRDKGLLPQAVEFFERALKTPGLTLEASKAAHYEIGACQEKLGKLPQALDHFARVYKADQAFRDVKARVAKLQASVKGANGAVKPAEKPVVKSVPAVGRASMPAPARPKAATPPPGAKPAAPAAKPATAAAKPVTPAPGTKPAAPAAKPAAPAAKPAPAAAAKPAPAPAAKEPPAVPPGGRGGKIGYV